MLPIYYNPFCVCVVRDDSLLLTLCKIPQNIFKLNEIYDINENPIYQVINERALLYKALKYKNIKII